MNDRQSPLATREANPGHLPQSIVTWSRDYFSRNQTWFYLFVVGLAFVVRYAYAQTPSADLLHLEGDAHLYDDMARNFLAGRGLTVTEVPSLVLPPLYPLFLALIYWLSGFSLAAVTAVQSAVGAFTCLLVYAIGKRTFGQGPAMLAAFVSIFYAPFIFWSAKVLTETLFVALIALTVLMLLIAQDRPSARNLALAGFLLGLTMLQRGVLLFFPVLLIVWALVRFPLKQALRSFAIIIAVMLLVMLPWTARNYVKYGRVIPVASHGGFLLFVANNPYTDPWQPFYSSSAQYDPKEKLPGAFAGEGDQEYYRKALEYIRTYPLTTAWNAYGRMSTYWTPLEFPPVIQAWVFKGPLVNALEEILIPLAALGAFLSLRRWRQIILLYLTILSISSVHLIFHVVSKGRFRVPIMSLVIVLAAYALWTLGQWWVNLIRSEDAGRERIRVSPAHVIVAAIVLVGYLAGTQAGVISRARPDFDRRRLAAAGHPMGDAALLANGTRIEDAILFEPDFDLDKSLDGADNGEKDVTVAPPDGKPDWFILDFNTRRLIDRLEIQWYSNKYRATAWTVEYSDGGGWKTLAEEKDWAPPGDTSLWSTTLPQPVEARKIKLTATAFANQDRMTMKRFSAF